MTTTSDLKAQTLSWKVGGMDCASCAATIRGALERLPGVSDVKLSVMTETMTLALDEKKTSRDAVEKRVASLGYTTAVAAAKTAPASQPSDECGCGRDHADGSQKSKGHDHSGYDHYLQSFDPRVVGLTGSREQVDAALNAYKAYAKKIPTDTGYTMDHSASVYLMRADGSFRTMIDYHEEDASALDKIRMVLR